MLLIDGFIFLQVKILGQLIPPKESVMEILNEFENEEDIYRFISFNNSVVPRIDKKYNPNLYPNNFLEEHEKCLHQIFTEIRTIENRQAEILNLKIFSPYSALCMWFKATTGYVKGLDLDKIQRIYTEKSKVVKGKTSFGITKSNTITLDENLFKYSSFLIAFSIEKGFNTQARELALTNLEMKELELRRHALYKLQIQRGKEIENHYADDENPVTRQSICPICKRYFNKKEGSKLVTCGSTECKTQYETTRKQSYRRSAQGFDPKFKIMARREKAYSGKSNPCKSCGEKRVLYLPESWCEKCIVKTHSS